MKMFRMAATLLAAATIVLSSCSKDDDHIPSKTFVLVHGAFQAPYAWQYVQASLEKAGQRVIVVELPGHGKDSTNPAALSIDAYKNVVVNAISGVKGNVILVGHSMGGVVITATAEQVPDRIEKLVYIAGFIPGNGQSLTDLALQDASSQLGPALVLAPDFLTLSLDKNKVASIFCQDGSAAVKDLVVKNYRPEPAIPFTNKIVVSAANYGKVAKYYVHTLNDNAIGIALQQQMVKAAGITNTYSLSTGHCPFLTQPDNVTKLLLEIGSKK